MSWTTTPTSGISVSGWHYNYDSIRSSTSTSARFALHLNGATNDIGSANDIEFRIENGNLVLDVNPGTNSANPNGFTHQPPLGTLSSQVTSATVNVGDTIRLYTAVNGSLNGSFVISSEFDITSSGTSTEGVPVVQWSAGFSKDPGSNYWRWTVTGLNTDSSDSIYLYDAMPTLSNSLTAIGVRTFAASSSSSTQYGLFTPDLTKTYYVINYLAGSSTNLNAVVLASKNFANKKVFCNFW